MKKMIVGLLLLLITYNIMASDAAEQKGDMSKKGFFLNMEHSAITATDFPHVVMLYANLLGAQPIKSAAVTYYKKQDEVSDKTHVFKAVSAVLITHDNRYSLVEPDGLKVVGEGFLNELKKRGLLNPAIKTSVTTPDNSAPDAAPLPAKKTVKFDLP